LTWFGHVEHKDDAHLLKHCVMVEVNGAGDHNQWDGPVVKQCTCLEQTGKESLRQSNYSVYVVVPPLLL